MLKALDIGNYIVAKYEKNNITNLKLQKLLYFVQGQYLAETSEPLFHENIIAWEYGPVVPEVYYNFNRFVADRIFLTEDEKKSCKKIFDKIESNPAAVNAIKTVMNNYGSATAGRLVAITHSQKPWKETYNTFGVDKVISKNLIKSHFSNN